MNEAIPEKAINIITYTSLDTTQEVQKKSFSGSRQLFTKAAQEFGVIFDGTEGSDWEGLLAGAHLVDHLLDVEKADIMTQIKSILRGDLRDDLAQKPQNSFRNYMLRQNDTKYNDIMARLELVTPMVRRQAAAQEASDVVAVRLEEAELLTYLLSLPIEGRTDAPARRQFNIWLAGWSRAGYLLDTFADMKLDYDNGDSGVEPTIPARMSIAKAAVKECYDATRKTPTKLLGSCAMVSVKYLLLNKKPDMTQDRD